MNTLHALTVNSVNKLVKVMGYSLLINIHKNITFPFSVQELVTARSRSDIQQYYEYLLAGIVLILM